MPELPKSRRSAASWPPSGGARLDVEILDSRWTVPRRRRGRGRLRGKGARVGRNGKYLVWELSDEHFLLVHLRMTGAFLLDPTVDPPTRGYASSSTTAIGWSTSTRGGSAPGTSPGAAARDAYLAARLGVEPMTPGFTADYLRTIRRVGARAPIKAFVLDQRRIAGVATSTPTRRCSAPDPPAAPRRCAARRPAGGAARGDRGVAADGIDAKGATIDDFRHVDGAYGSFQERFLVHLREGEPCSTAATTIRKLVVGGRGTYVCEHCQPRPRARRRPSRRCRRWSASARTR